MSCGTEQFSASVTPMSDEEPCCCHEEGGIHNVAGNSEMMLSDDCCSHESERMVTDELVRTEVQNEVVPYFLVAAIVAVIPEHSQYTRHTYSVDKASYGIRDVTTMLCQIIS